MKKPPKNNEVVFDWDKLASLSNSRDSLAIPPAHAITITMLMKKRGMGRSGASEILNKLVKAGTLDCGMFLTHAERKWTRYFWLKSGDSK